MSSSQGVLVLCCLPWPVKRKLYAVKDYTVNSCQKQTLHESLAPKLVNIVNIFFRLLLEELRPLNLKQNKQLSILNKGESQLKKNLITADDS